MISRWPRLVWCLFFSLISAYFSPPSSISSDRPVDAPSIEVYFSPHGGATGAVVREIRGAKLEVLVQAYSFTSGTIAKALVDAHKRGVKVTVTLDKSQRGKQYASADFFRNAGVPTYIDYQHQIAHNKIMIIDGATIITGSLISRRPPRRGTLRTFSSSRATQGWRKSTLPTSRSI